MDILGLDDSQEKLLILLANILENGKLAKLIVESSDRNWDFNTLPIEFIHGTPAGHLPDLDFKYRGLIWKIINSNKSTLETLGVRRDAKFSFTNKNTELELYRPEPDLDSKLHIKSFSGVDIFFTHGDPRSPGSWLHVLRQQEKIQVLDLRYNDFEIFSQEMARSIEDITSQIVLKNTATLTVIKIFAALLPFGGGAVMNYGTAFLACTSLKHLTLEHYPLLSFNAYNVYGVFPTFMGTNTMFCSYSLKQIS
jgi:hypothetical protein